MSNFKIVLTAIFAICIVVGIALFALSKGSSTTTAANLVVWGTLPTEVFNAAYKNSSLESNKQISISYVKVPEGTFDADFLEALASGQGPDIVLIKDTSVYKHRNKLFVIPYDSYSARNFKDNFLPVGEIFLSAEGVIALPFTLDPLVMYWNRDMFSNALIPTPPKYWDEIYGLVDKMTKRDSGGNILQSAIALGAFSNITNAKEIVSQLLLQAGTPIVSRSLQGVISVLNSQFDYPIAPSQSAINFYTQFGNPTSPAYSWNRSLPSSLNFFLSGNLAMYIGFASEISSIQQKNPNLNFDVTYVPQIRDAPKKLVFAHSYSLSIVKQSKQIAGAFLALAGLTENSSLKSVGQITLLPPVRLDLIKELPIDSFQVVFYNSALLSKSWIDPDGVATATIFRDMIDSITSGRKRQNEALSDANLELNSLLSK